MTQQPNPTQQGKKNAKKTVKTVVTAVVVLLLVAAIAFVLTVRLRGEPLFIAGYTVLWVQTDSMENTIPEKSFILAEKVSAKDVAEGDVITFICDEPGLIYGQLNTHRVVEVIGDHEEFVTKGDHNVAKDHTTAKADKVLARYVRNLTVLSALGRFFTTPAGLVVAAVCIALFCLLLYLPEIRKALNRKKETQKREAEEKQALMDEKIRQEVEKLKQNGESGDPPKDPEA